MGLCFENTYLKEGCLLLVYLAVSVKTHRGQQDNLCRKRNRRGRLQVYCRRQETSGEGDDRSCSGLYVLPSWSPRQCQSGSIGDRHSAVNQRLLPVRRPVRNIRNGKTDVINVSLTISVATGYTQNK